VIAEGGPRVNESKPDADSAAAGSSPLHNPNTDGTVSLPPGPQMVTSLGRGVIIVQAQQKPIRDLVKVMGRMINQSLGENPNDFESPKARVIDQTGLNGTYDFTLRFSCELCQFAVTNGSMASPIPASNDSMGGEPSLFVALQKQLGLKLVKRKEVLLDVIVVDHVEKSPSAN